MSCLCAKEEKSRPFEVRLKPPPTSKRCSRCSWDYTLKRNLQPTTLMSRTVSCVKKNFVSTAYIRPGDFSKIHVLLFRYRIDQVHFHIHFTPVLTFVSDPRSTSLISVKHIEVHLIKKITLPQQSPHSSQLTSQHQETFHLVF